jgi:hypothetical protein
MGAMKTLSDMGTSIRAISVMSKRKERLTIQQRLLRLALSIFFISTLVACSTPPLIAHLNINIAPNVDLIRGDIEAQINLKVAYQIDEASRALEVTSPGGSGYKLHYFPYRDLDLGFSTSLGKVFSEVVPVVGTPSDAWLKKNGVSLIVKPRVTTESFGDSILVAPRSFTVFLSCAIFNQMGEEIDNIAVIGRGGAESNEMWGIDDRYRQLAATRASNDALSKLITALSKSRTLQAAANNKGVIQIRQADEKSTRLDVANVPQEQEKATTRISIKASATKPDADGGFFIHVQTSVDTVSLKIDDEEQGASEQGNYTVRRLARVGQANIVKISAVDRNGNTDTKTISVVRQAVDSRPAFARLTPDKIKPRPARDAVAIIIGIQNYKLIPKAEYANQDAQVFYDYASRALGIQQENIKLLVDDEADVSGIYKAFQNWLPLKVRKGKTDVYVFYSGHGLPSADGKSLYFLPVGADRDLIAKTAISQKEIVDALKTAQPKSVTMFIDSCYSGQIRTGETLLASARPVVLSVQETAYPPEFTVITASASDQIASSSPDLKHGIFSYYLMKGLEGEADENKDGTITIGKLQSYLAERVPRFAMTMSRKQEPQLTGDASRVLVAR